MVPSLSKSERATKARRRRVCYSTRCRGEHLDSRPGTAAAVLFIAFAVLFIAFEVLLFGVAVQCSVIAVPSYAAVISVIPEQEN